MKRNLDKAYEKTQSCSQYFKLYAKKDKENFPEKNQDKPYAIFPIRCKSNLCPICSKIKTNQLIQDLLHNCKIENLRFFTLTLKPTNSVVNDLKTIEASFNLLQKKLKKKYPHLEYFRVIEIGSNSSMVHIHGLWNIYIEVRELSNLWESLTGSYRIDLKRVNDNYSTILYLCKYLFKSNYNKKSAEFFYKNNKRKYSSSKNFFEKTEKKSLYEPFILESFSLKNLDDSLRILQDHYFINPNLIDYSIKQIFPSYDAVIFPEIYECDTGYLRIPDEQIELPF